MNFALPKPKHVQVTATKPQRRGKLVRRVLLVCNHPDVGVSVFDRMIFNYKKLELLEEFLRTKDQCRRREPIQRRAQVVLEYLFAQTHELADYLGEFQCSSGTRFRVSMHYSVFWFDLADECFYEQQPSNRYIALSHHHHDAAVRPMIAKSPFASALGV